MSRLAASTSRVASAGIVGAVWEAALQRVVPRSAKGPRLMTVALDQRAYLPAVRPPDRRLRPRRRRSISSRNAARRPAAARSPRSRDSQPVQPSRTSLTGAFAHHVSMRPPLSTRQYYHPFPRSRRNRPSDGGREGPTTGKYERRGRRCSCATNSAQSIGDPPPPGPDNRFTQRIQS